MKLVELICKYARQADHEDKRAEGEQLEETPKQELKMGLPVAEEQPKAKVKARVRKS
jgi:hypothetical protein